MGLLPILSCCIVFADRGPWEGSSLVKSGTRHQGAGGPGCVRTLRLVGSPGRVALPTVPAPWLGTCSPLQLTRKALISSLLPPVAPSVPTPSPCGPPL